MYLKSFQQMNVFPLSSRPFFSVTTYELFVDALFVYVKLLLNLSGAARDRGQAEFIG
jgi:hypothetical protein